MDEENVEKSIKNLARSTFNYLLAEGFIEEVDKGSGKYTYTPEGYALLTQEIPT